MFISKKKLKELETRIEILQEQIGEREYTFNIFADSKEYDSINGRMKRVQEDLNLLCEYLGVHKTNDTTKFIKGKRK